MIRQTLNNSSLLIKQDDIYFDKKSFVSITMRKKDIYL